MAVGTGPVHSEHRWTAPGGSKESTKNATGNCEVVQRGEGLRLHRPEDGSADVFVHYTESRGSGFRTLEENQRVEFEVGQEPPRVLQATGVRAV